MQREKSKEVEEQVSECSWNSGWGCCHSLRVELMPICHIKKGVFPPQKQGVFPPLYRTHFQSAQRSQTTVLIILHWQARGSYSMIGKGKTWLKSISHDLGPLNVASSVTQSFFWAARDQMLPEVKRGADSRVWKWANFSRLVGRCWGRGDKR